MKAIVIMLALIVPATVSAQSIGSQAPVEMCDGLEAPTADECSEPPVCVCYDLDDKATCYWLESEGT